MLLDESVNRATQLGLELDAKRDALAAATKELEESERKRVAAESALAATRLKFSGTFSPKSLNYFVGTQPRPDLPLPYLCLVVEEKLKEASWASSSIKDSAQKSLRSVLARRPDRRRVQVHNR